MNNLLKLYISRILRKDMYVPQRCNAHNYMIPKGTWCNCKIWCKYPSPGNSSKLYLREHNNSV